MAYRSGPLLWMTLPHMSAHIAAQSPSCQRGNDLALGPIIVLFFQLPLACFGREQMPDARASIEKHYGSDGLVDRILASLEAAGHDTANLTVEELNLVDQMHFGGLNSTKSRRSRLA